MARPIVFFCGYFLFLLLHIHPDRLYYAIVGARLEPFPVFLTGKAFFLQACRQPGGIGDYAAALLSQSYAISWLGAAVTTLLCLGIFLLLRPMVLHKNSLAIFLPSLVSLWMVNRYELPIALLTNSLIALACAALFAWYVSKFRSTRLWLFPVFFVVVTLTIGRGVAVFFIITAPLVFQNVIPKSGLKRFSRIFNLVPALGFLIVGYFIYKVFRASGPLLPIYYSYSAGHFHLYWFDCAFALSLALCRALPTILKYFPIKAPPQWFFSSYYESAIGLTIAITGLYFSHNTWIRNHIYLENLTHKNQWNDILAFAGKLRPKDFDVITVYDVNSALFHTGKLSSEMFRWPQSIPALVLPGAFEKSPVSLGLRRAFFYFELGEVNMAQQKLYEVAETASEHPLVLSAIAETHIVKDQIAAAKLVYTRLEKDLVYRHYAKAMLRNLMADTAYDVGTRLSDIRSHVTDLPRADKSLYAGIIYAGGVYNSATETKSDTVLGSVDIVALCQRQLAHNKHNSMAFEYLMALYLVSGDLESFSSNINRAKDAGYTALPCYWSEALALYIDLLKISDQRLTELAGTDALDREAHFKELFIGPNADWDLRKLPTYTADTQNQDRLRRVFGATYFYFFFFQHSGLAG